MNSERRILVVGAGGLGCPAILSLAWSNVRHLTVVDPDVVDESNLPRQLWHHPQDVGLPKVQSLKQKLSRYFPQMDVVAVQEKVTESNVYSFIEGHDVIVDGTDGISTKFLLSDAAVKTRTILVYGGVVRLLGQVMKVFPGGPCLRCLFEHPPLESEVPTCAGAGVMGAMAGLIGGIQGALALEPLVHAQGAQLYVIDGATLKGRKIWVTPRPDCEGCQSSFEHESKR